MRDAGTLGRGDVGMQGRWDAGCEREGIKSKLSFAEPILTPSSPLSDNICNQSGCWKNWNNTDKNYFGPGSDYDVIQGERICYYTAPYGSLNIRKSWAGRGAMTCGS